VDPAFLPIQLDVHPPPSLAPRSGLLTPPNASPSPLPKVGPSQKHESSNSRFLILPKFSDHTPFPVAIRLFRFSSFPYYASRGDLVRPVTSLLSSTSLSESRNLFFCLWIISDFRSDPLPLNVSGLKTVFTWETYLWVQHRRAVPSPSPRYALTHSFTTPPLQTSENQLYRRPLIRLVDPLSSFDGFLNCPREPSFPAFLGS